MSRFTHLHVHSHYSLLDGLPKIDLLLDYVKKLGMESVALTDHGNIYGAVEFYKKAKEKGIKPIIGCEFYLALTKMDLKRPNIDDKRYHLTLLVKNEQGYKNLVKLITQAHLKGFYYKPRIDEELLTKHSSGLICLSGCLQGKIPKLILASKMADAYQIAFKYQEIFGQDNFYLEIQHHPNISDQKTVNKGLIAISTKLNIPLVATNDVHYLKPEDAEAQDVLMMINTGSNSNDSERLTMKMDDFSMHSPQKMADFFKGTPQALLNTQKIVDDCHFEFKLGEIKLPSFPLPEAKKADDYLKELCVQGLKKRNLKPNREIKDRLEYELSVIKEMGFASYFLIVQDFVNWAKQNRIVTGPGRGSVAGSLVSYLLNITNVDPIKYNLLFERFLTLGRSASPPDFDLDFTDRRRNEVINYVAQKYGQDKVAQIITFGTMAARAVVRDVGRALNYPYSFCDRLAKMIPFGWTLDKTLANADEFRQLYITDPSAKKLIDFAIKLEGVARHASTHACGVVISDTALDEIVPLQHPSQKDQTIVTQYEMHSIEDLGLLKIDLLGLKNLTIIEDTLARIYKVQDKQIDIETIPFDDKKTYKLLQTGETVGVFQLESPGMQRYLKQLKPTEFEDIIAMVSLYRPGPIQLIPDYIAGKHKKKKIEYLHPKLKPILESTYGICVSGDSLVQTANPGGIHQICELVNSPTKVSVQSLDFSKDQFQKKNITHKFNNGMKNVYEIRLRTGKKIKATEDHQFLTPEGWKKLRELNRGDFLATPKKLFTGKRKFNKNKLKVLAYLIADGALTEKLSCYFVNKNALLLKDFKKSAESSFKNVKINFTKHIRNVKRAIPIKINHSGSLYHQPNAILKWLRGLGLKYKLGGKSSAEKFFPPFVFELNEKCICTFLATLWDCDGGIAKKMAYITTISEKLAYNTQTLLLKLGINSYIYITEKYKSRNNKTMQVFRVYVYDLGLFSKKIGRLMLSNKKERLIETDKRGASSCNEFVLRELFFKKLNDYLEKTHLSKRAFCRLYKVNRSNLWGKLNKIRNRLNIKIAQKIANIINDEKLKRIVKNNNVRWEDIVLITHAGKECVYDIEVEKTHNFIVNNILSHNCLYQEQVMEIAKELASFTLSEADVLRKAIGKKIKKLLMEQKEKFIKGMKANGIEETTTQKIWAWIEPFASYSFNRSHAACYATIAYQTAYLKTHFPVEFMAAALTSERNDITRIAVLIQECKNMGIRVLAPDINESFIFFSVVPKLNQIRFGLSAIKNVGTNIVETIVKERKANGPYLSIQDFISRISCPELNKKSLESLIKTGAFDKMLERNQLLFNLERLLEYSRENQKAKQNNQTGLFDNAGFNNEIRLLAAEPAPTETKLAWEKELLGLFISSHPLHPFKKILEKKTLAIAKISSRTLGKRVMLGGIISKIVKITTKTDQTMLFINLEDLTDKIEVVVFPDIIKRNSTLLIENKIVLIEGRIDSRGGTLKLICEEIQEITSNETQ
ncbi:MAG: DNA polymerase III subunit alpha [Candidatus Nealsonbacteria bacterium]|nr:DNA polymerase III subunit alpha [Candidatus Nealsonbacteria bacterium]